MEKFFKYFMLIVLTFSISIAITSCGDDEPDSPNQPDTPVVTPPADDDDSADDDDPAKYDIVGKWKMEIYDKNNNYGCDILEIDKSGHLLVSEIIYKTGNTYTAVGTWTYDAKNKQWNITIDGTFNRSGVYRIVGNKLIHVDDPEHTYTKVDDDQPTQSGQLAGTTWVTTYDYESFEISFNNDGTYSEIYGTEYIGSMKYWELADNTIMFESGGLLYNTFGWDPISFELNSSKTKLTLKDEYETITFTRKR